MQLINHFVSPQVMGILNITPDSFFSGSRKQTEKEIAERVVQMMEEGADMMDVGGYSSRPSAVFVSAEEEMQRLRFGLEILFREAPQAVVSIDTFRADVARECVEKFGASIINDIAAGGLDEKMFDTIADLKVPYIIMHMCGTPQTMMQHTHYDRLMPEILLYFAEKINRLHQKGVTDIWVDPGFGFSKTTAQNYELLNKLEQFTIFDLPLLVGFSRKTMIREVIGVSSEEALNGTTALDMFALTKGADILRVHDVKEAVQAVQLYNKIGCNVG
ncbi:MAG: Dihydropteroate synthase [Candidatus Ordinivivax streblomastigis]|uniref:dihydropteroate synthase n=1 Tax=Candidatus Ordinivivax streblomastigis TaxID=2540710 RepID=A0A5M8P567_9BACT|nr:MAG: Dihydropteroate synthase [Candidatus Ordinivivax streblomastigis]